MIHSINNPIKSSGFSLVELVTVIILVGILSVYAVPKFIGTSSVSANAAQNIVITAAKRAQQMAMNRGPAANVQLQTDNSNHVIRIIHTGPNSPITFSLESDVQISPASTTLTYDVLGNPNAALTINLTGNETRCVQIEATGFAHAC